MKIFVCNVDLKKIETCFTIAHPANLSGKISGRRKRQDEMCTSHGLRFGDLNLDGVSGGSRYSRKGGCEP